MTPGWVLKLGATLLTLLATTGSTAFVTGHVKNPNAPLHPTVQAGQYSVAPGGRLTITPSVRTTDVKPITSTYAS
jgi:hypothetical protein